MIKLTQNHFEKDGKILAYVDVTIAMPSADGKDYEYKAQFDPHTRKRINACARSHGFHVGECIDVPERRTIEI